MPPTTKQAEKATVVNFFEWVKERINTFAPLPACLTDCLVPEQVSREQECVRDYEALQLKHRSSFGDDESVRGGCGGVCGRVAAWRVLCL